jgi:hypothetical protein
VPQDLSRPLSGASPNNSLNNWLTTPPGSLFHTLVWRHGYTLTEGILFFFIFYLHIIFILSLLFLSDKEPVQTYTFFIQPVLKKKLFSPPTL